MRDWGTVEFAIETEPAINYAHMADERGVAGHGRLGFGTGLVGDRGRQIDIEPVVRLERECNGGRRGTGWVRGIDAARGSVACRHPVEPSRTTTPSPLAPPGRTASPMRSGKRTAERKESDGNGQYRDYHQCRSFSQVPILGRNVFARVSRPVLIGLEQVVMQPHIASEHAHARAESQQQQRAADDKAGNQPDADHEAVYPTDTGTTVSEEHDGEDHVRADSTEGYEADANAEGNGCHDEQQR